MSIRALLHKPRKIIALAIVSTIITVAVLFRDELIAESFPAGTVGDEIREARGEKALEVVQVEEVELGDTLYHFARPDEFRLSPAEEKVLADFMNPRWDDVLKKLRKGAVNTGWSNWKIYLRGNRNQGLRITNINVVDLKKQPPLRGTLVYIPSQGEEESSLLGANLDEIRPVVRDMEIKNGQVSIGDTFFPLTTIKLDDKGERILVIRAITKRHSASFRLDIEYQVGDSTERIKVDHNGQPFKVTALNCAGKNFSYESYYSLDGGQPGTTYGVYPVQPSAEFDC